MHILITTPIYPPEIGGPASYVAELAKRLSKKHPVKVITFSNQLATRNTPLVTYIPTFESSLLRQLRLFLSVFTAARSAHLIYAQGTMVVGVCSYLAARIFKRKLIIKFVGDEIWETAYNSGKTQLSLEAYYQTLQASRFKLWLHRFVLKKANHIIVPSKYLKNFLINSHKIDTNKIRVISNAVSSSALNLAHRTSHKLITVGRLVKTKNIDQIIHAVALARKIKPWKLMVVGDGLERKTLELLAARCKLQASVTFTGSLPESEVNKLIARSSKLILMSNYEGQSHTLLQALTNGTPIIASDIAPNRELIKNNGILVPLNNPHLLAKAINQPKVVGVKPSGDYSWEKHVTELMKVAGSNQ